MKIDPTVQEETLIQTLLMRFQEEGISCSAYILLHHKRLKQQVISDRVVQWSTPWVIFFMVPHNSSSCLWLFPFSRMITLTNPYLLAPPGPTKITTMAWQHTYFTLTFVYSLPPSPLPFLEILTHRGILLQKGSFSNTSPCFW